MLFKIGKKIYGDLYCYFRYSKMRSLKLIIKSTTQKVMDKFGLGVDFMTLNMYKLGIFSYYFNSL